MYSNVAGNNQVEGDACVSRRRSEAANSTRDGRAFVQHVYHDHVNDPVCHEDDELCCNAIGNGLKSGFLNIAAYEPFPNKKQRRGPRGGVAEPFPVKLYEMLSEVENDDDVMDIVNWQPHGRCFVIHQPKKFFEVVMPKYFKQSQFASFQRQVNLYGFRRLTKGKDRGAYYHELFLRGRPDLCKRIVRQRVKGNGTKAASSPATEPDFYKMKLCTENMLSVTKSKTEPGQSTDKLESRLEEIESSSFAQDTFQMGNIICANNEIVGASHLFAHNPPAKDSMHRPMFSIAFLSDNVNNGESATKNIFGNEITQSNHGSISLSCMAASMNSSHSPYHPTPLSRPSPIPTFDEVSGSLTEKEIGEVSPLPSQIFPSFALSNYDADMPLCHWPGPRPLASASTNKLPSDDQLKDEIEYFGSIIVDEFGYIL